MHRDYLSHLVGRAAVVVNRLTVGEEGKTRCLSPETAVMNGDEGKGGSKLKTGDAAQVM